MLWARQGTHSRKRSDTLYTDRCTAVHARAPPLGLAQGSPVIAASRDETAAQSPSVGKGPSDQQRTPKRSHLPPFHELHTSVRNHDCRAPSGRDSDSTGCVRSAQAPHSKRTELRRAARRTLRFYNNNTRNNCAPSHAWPAAWDGGLTPRSSAGTKTDHCHDNNR